MRFLHTFQLLDFLDTLVSLFTALVLGTLIGAERQYRQRRQCRPQRAAAEIVASLTRLSFERAELDAVTARLGTISGVRHASWNMRVSD